MIVMMLDRDCEIDENAFSGCGTVYVFAPKGGSTEEYCNDPAHNNLVFVEIQETLEPQTSLT